MKKILAILLALAMLFSGRRAQGIRGMRSAECPVVEAAGEGGLAAGGTFQAKYLVPQERKRCACLEGYTDLCDTGKRYGSVKMHENKPDGIL